MKQFPMFLNIEGRPVLICGGGKKALEKVLVLQKFCPRLCVLTSESILPEMEGLPDVQIKRHAFSELDLEVDPAFVIAAEGLDENRRIAEICKQHRIPVNAVDQPELCDFTFPALILREHLCIGIGTGGSAPAAAAELKERIDRQIPDRIDEILDWLTGVRAEIYDRSSCREEAKVLLRKVTASALDMGRPLTEEEILELSE